MRKIISFFVASGLLFCGLYILHFVVAIIDDGGPRPSRRAIMAGMAMATLGGIWILGDFVLPLYRRKRRVAPAASLLDYAPQSDAERAKAVLGDAIAITAEKWLFFTQSMEFKHDVPLADRIGAFSVPMYEGLRKNIPLLKDAPEPLLLRIVAKGIEKSGTHSPTEIEQAIGAPTSLGDISKNIQNRA